MKISIDLDGTLYFRINFFRELMWSMQKFGHQVGILTGHADNDKDKIFKQLSDLRFPIPDFYFGRTEEYMPFNGAKFKSMIIQRENIDIHFDDYDYDNPDTENTFKALGQENKIIRIKYYQP